jgi:hypothetical protein
MAKDSLMVFSSLEEALVRSFAHINRVMCRDYGVYDMVLWQDNTTHPSSGGYDKDECLLEVSYRPKTERSLGKRYRLAFTKSPYSTVVASFSTAVFPHGKGWTYAIEDLYFECPLPEYPHFQPSQKPPS